MTMNQEAIIKWYEEKCEPILRSWFDNDKDMTFSSGDLSFDLYFMEWVKEYIERGDYKMAIKLIEIFMDYIEEYIRPVAQGRAEEKYSYEHEKERWKNIKHLIDEWSLLNQYKEE